MMRKSGIDRDVAEFISGRKLEGIGPKHYAELIMLAEEQYPQYAAYLKALREKCYWKFRMVLEMMLEMTLEMAF